MLSLVEEARCYGCGLCRDMCPMALRQK
ncbi:MAG: 4Fe-4S binding protein [Anaerolineae bacterium]|nr:4Fe-4S binding protein [Anaerolineae bacterium]